MENEGCDAEGGEQEQYESITAIQQKKKEVAPPVPPYDKRGALPETKSEAVEKTGKTPDQGHGHPKHSRGFSYTAQSQPVASTGSLSVASSNNWENEESYVNASHIDRCGDGRPKGVSVLDVDMTYCNLGGDPGPVQLPRLGGPPPGPTPKAAPKTFSSEDGRYIFPFTEANDHYFEVAEEENDAVLPEIADKFDLIMRRGWQEVFSVCRIVLSIVFYFVLELVLFLSRDVFQKVIVRVLATVGDFVIKPLLSTLFNDWLQPVFVFLWNVTRGLFTHALRPVQDLVTFMTRQVSAIVGHFRLVDIRRGRTETGAMATEQNV